MPTLATRVSAATAATLLAQNTASSSTEGDYQAQTFLLKNVTASASVFLGGSGVTTGSGFQWDFTDGAVEVVLEPGESLYGIVSATAQTIHVLRTGR